jgi:predicted RND superfamily exporter protein
MIVLAAVGFVVSIISKLSVVSEIGVLIGRGALLSGFLVIFVLPALLLLTDKIIIKEGK